MTLRIFLAGGTGLVGRMAATRLAAQGNVQLTAPARGAPGGVDYERLCDDPAHECVE